MEAIYGWQCVCVHLYVYMFNFFPLSLEFPVFPWWVFLQSLLSEDAGAPGRALELAPPPLADGKLKLS